MEAIGDLTCELPPRRPRPGFIGITADSIGLGASIMIVGFVACALAITCVWLLPETRGKVIVEPERSDRQLAGAAS